MLRRFKNILLCCARLSFRGGKKEEISKCVLHTKRSFTGLITTTKCPPPAYISKKIHLKMSLSRNHGPVSQNNPQILLWAVSCRNYFVSYRNHFLTHKTLLIVLGGCEYKSTIQSHYIWEKAEISMANISKTRSLAPKLSRLINSSTGKRKNMFCFLFWGELSL